MIRYTNMIQSTGVLRGCYIVGKHVIEEWNGIYDGGKWSKGSTLRDSKGSIGFLGAHSNFAYA